MSPRPNHLPAWQDFHDTVELADSELVGARFQFTYHCRGALKNHVASFDGIALLTGCQWGNTDHTVVLVPIDLKRINMRPGCTDPIHVVREFWIPDSSFPDGYRNRVIEEDLFPEPNTPSTYSTVVINALRGLSAYDLYVQQGGNLTLQQWLQIGGYSQEVMQTINNLVTNLRETLGLDIAQAIQTAHQAMVDAADRAAAQAQASAQSAQQAADSVQQAADLATVQATAQAQAAAQSAQTATAEAEAAHAQAEASQQAADAAAADLAEARAKVAQILAAITGIDPQSTEGSIQTIAAKQGVLETELEQLVPKIDQLGVWVESGEFIHAFVDADDKVLFGIRPNGEIYWAIGVPKPVKDYIETRIPDISGLQQTIEGKVDKVEGKGLSTNDYTDEDKDVVEISQMSSDPVFVHLILDVNKAILFGIEKNGNVHFGCGVPSQIQDAINEAVSQISPSGLQDVLDFLGSYVGGSTTLQTMIEGLQANIMTDEQKYKVTQIDVLPSFYHTNDYIENKIADINEQWMQSGANADIFAFFTDAHYYNKAGHTGELLEYIALNSHVKKVVFGGDVCTVEQALETPMLYEEVNTHNLIVSKVLRSARFFPVRGNHDYYSRNTTAYGKTTLIYPYAATYNSILNQCNEPRIVLNENDIAPYYYFDEEFSKTRYIILDMFYKSTGVAFGSYQIPFVANALLTTPAGYTITIVGHTSIQSGMMHDTTEYTNLQPLRDLVHAFQTNGTFSYDGVTYDFSSAVAKILMWVSGHSHEDMQNYVDDVLFVCTPCSSRYTNILYSAMATYHEYPRRTADTINEDCVDIVIADKSNGIVYTKRIGSGFDRYFNLTKNTLSVGSTLTLTSRFDNVATWLIHDAEGAVYNSSAASGTERWTFTNNVATIANGVVTGIASGECHAIAIASNGDKEFFYIKVN